MKGWAARIAVLYIGFVVMIITLVAATFRSKPVLVAQDYYLRETEFQKQLDAARATSKLEAPPQLIRQGDSLRVVFPASLGNVHLEGSITLYFPAADGADQRILFNTDDAAIRIKAPQGKPAYQVQLDWTGNGVHYYYQCR